VFEVLSYPWWSGEYVVAVRLAAGLRSSAPLPGKREVVSLWSQVARIATDLDKES